MIYIQPSPWVVELWKNIPLCNGIPIKDFSFGVDTQKFINIKPIQERDNVIVYFKHREPNELVLMELFLQSKNINYRVFSYDQRYNENDYLSYLQNSKFMVCVDAHESQGFAIEEALSCDVPLFVWNINSMQKEHGSNYPDIPATSIPYWDDCCGEFFYNWDELESKFDTFISKINEYTPRKFILENLSIEKCEEKLIALLHH
jgi:hypothetical protein